MQEQQQRTHANTYSFSRVQKLLRFFIATFINMLIGNSCTSRGVTKARCDEDGNDAVDVDETELSVIVG